MSRGQKFGYWLSEWVIGWLVFYGLLFGTVPSSDGKMLAIAILLGVGVVMFLPMVLIKSLAIRQSNIRVARARATHGQ
jgi:hypothetical protein